MKAGISRPFEVAISLAGLIVAAPLILISALAIAATSRGPILFRQKRVGLGGRLFTLCKLRTMRIENDGIQVTAGDDVRVTPLGRILRKTKLDELPELWNVFRGDMSLVGPRPEVPRYVDLENPAWRLVLQVKPGITDPVSLSLRNEESLMSRVKDDRQQFYLEVLQPLKLKGYVDYLRARNWWSDVKVLFKTVVVLVSPRNAPPPEFSDMPEGAVEK